MNVNGENGPPAGPEATMFVEGVTVSADELAAGVAVCWAEFAAGVAVCDAVD